MDGQPRNRCRGRWLGRGATGLILVALVGVGCSLPARNPTSPTSTTYPNALHHRVLPAWLDDVCPGLVAATGAPAKALAGLDPNGVRGNRAVRTRLRDELVARLDAQALVVGRADHGLADAGDPDVRSGDQLRDALRLGLSDERDGFRAASRLAAAAPVGDASAFERAITGALGRIEPSTAGLVAAVTTLHANPDISASLGKHQACRDL